MAVNRCFRPLPARRQEMSLASPGICLRLHDWHPAVYNRIIVCYGSGAAVPLLQQVCSKGSNHSLLPVCVAGSCHSRCALCWVHVVQCVSPWPPGFSCAVAATRRCTPVIPGHARCVFVHAWSHLPGVVAPCRNSGVARCVVLSQALVREKCSGTCSKCHVAAASMFVFAVWGTRLAGSMMLMPRSIACSLACMHPNGSRT